MSSPISSGRGTAETTRTNKEKTTNVNGVSKVTTRNESRKTGVTVTTQRAKEDTIKNAVDGRRFLEKHLLLCPVGEPITTAALAYCLHQISEMSGPGGKMMADAARSAAFLAGELEENSINEVVRDAVLSQINELAQDMKSLVEDAKEKIDDHAQMKATSIQSNPPPPQARPPPDHPPPRRSYAETLINPPPHANPKLAAREGIRARQIMLEGIDQKLRIGQMDGTQLKAELNKILEEAGVEGKGIRSAIIQRNKGVLVEMDNDRALEWIRKPENKIAFCIEVGPDVVFKARSHTVIAFNAPLTIDLENETHRKEILDANHFEAETVNMIRWVKPASRRTTEQKSAHLFISFTDATSANRAISNGLTICNKKIRTEKVKKEPTRCLKCQGWNHQAYECVELHDRCGNCAEDHRTDQCPHPHRTRCVSCDSDDHASWNRRCPTYLRKVSDCDSRNPENLLQFFLTTESWTWTAQVEAKTSGHRGHDVYRPGRTDTDTCRPGRHNTHRPNQNDTYRPGQADSYRPEQNRDMYRPSQGRQVWGASRRVDWSVPPIWDEELPPSKSWHDETPYDSTQLFHQTANKAPPPRPTTAPSAEPLNA
jgi:hypothetical protein